MHAKSKSHIQSPSCIGQPNFSCRHRQLEIFQTEQDPLIRPHIEGMKSELIKYHALVKSIKPLDQRKDAKDKDTFVLSDWWRCNSGELPHFAFVLRAVLTNAPNSCLSERLFSMFNASFGEYQQRSFGDYLTVRLRGMETEPMETILRFAS